MSRERLHVAAVAILILAIAVTLGCSGYGAKSSPSSSGAYQAPPQKAPSQTAPQQTTQQPAPPAGPASQATPQAVATHTVTEGDAPAAYSVHKAGDITLSWMVDGKMLHVKVSAPTTGWVAVGFDPKSHMEGANLILGYVKDGQVHIEDDYATQPYGHASDVSLGGTDNVTDAAGTESGGVTEISFTIPLDSGDQYDRVLVPGQTYKIILAHGADGVDDFITHHAEHKEASITI